MTLRFVSGMGPSPGVSFGQDMAIMLSPSTVAVGDVLSIDTTVVDASFRWTTVKAVATADFVTASSAVNAEAPQCVALDAASAAGTHIRCLFRGNARALVTSATTVGVTRLIPTNASGALVVNTAPALPGGASGAKVVAIALETNATASVLKEVMFDGWGGFGRCITNGT